MAETPVPFSWYETLLPFGESETSGAALISHHHDKH